MVRIARQVDDATLDGEPSIHTIINASSPLRFDEPMLEGILQYSRAQPAGHGHARSPWPGRWHR